MTNTDTNKTVAVIGLGLMGSALADALLSAGFPVTVWNRTAQKSEAFRDRGAVIADSVGQAVSAADVIIFCVTDYTATKEILFHDEIGKKFSGKLLVQLSTIIPEQSHEIETWARPYSAEYLEGSIIGLPTLSGCLA